MRRVLCLIIAAGCGGGGGDDWTKRPVKPVSATVEGIAFAIELPEGMRLKAKPDEARWDFLVGEYAKTPEITVREGGFAKTLEDYLKVEPKVDNWLRKETLPDGYIVSNENDAYKGQEDYLVYVYKTFGDKVLTCHARVTPWERGATVKDKVPLVEKMCLSMKLAK
jgi:hypothetical protein